MLTELVQIRRLGEQKRDENSRFRLHLKRHNFQERRLKRIAENIEEQIDCTACASCCRVATVKIMERDAQKLAKGGAAEVIPGPKKPVRNKMKPKVAKTE